MSGKERDDRLEAFQAGKYQIAVNYNVLTTGFDHQPIDLIVMLRATKSVPLWVQMLGRGTRIFSGDNFFPPKRNCLVLDFAGNTKRLGPINDPVIPRAKGQAGGDAPVKICEECGTYNHISVRFCVGCGAEFSFAEKTQTKASDLEVIRDITPVYEEFDVEMCHYRRHHSKRSGLDSFCAMHYCKNGRVIEEYVAIEGKGRARERAVQWWAQRSPTWCPSTIEEALHTVTSLRVPSRILVQTNVDFPHIERCFYDN
jgi:DNA repair protein RadD